jgi:catechol 2,3-dioxygenase-like lactoylglutathione lyase family enzyme
MGLPGLRRVDHVGFTVPDLDAAHAFLVDVIGCEYLYSLGPFAHPDEGDDWMTRHLGVHPQAEMVENRWFRCGDQAMFEVFHYRSPDQRDAIPRNSDIGGHHVALYVDDLDAAIEHLRAHDVDVFDGPTASRGPAEGNRWIYFRSPWGMQFELVSYPGGKAYERAGGGRADM